jgi:hypothetical protein
MYKLLRAYANSDLELGYVQGLAFPAGMLMCYCDENVAFGAFYEIMHGLKLRDLYIRGFANLRLVTEVFKLHLSKHVPNVSALFAKMELDASWFTTSWFLTAFLGLQLPIRIQLNIFDCFCKFGVRALLSMGVAICKMEERNLAGPLEEVLPLLQHPERMGCMRQEKALWRAWQDVWLPNVEYERLLRKVSE